MKSSIASKAALCALFTIICAGCTTPSENSDVALASSADGVVLGTTATQTDAANVDAGATSNAPATGEKFDSLMANGRVRNSGDYQLFDLGASDAGDQWTLTPASGSSGSFVAAIFDENQSLLMRGYINGTNGLSHIMRWSTSKTYLGVMTPSFGGGGDFRIRADRAAGVGVPEPLSQVVYLNFADASNVRVYSDPPVSFAAFDGSMLGDAYANSTQVIKDTIVASMRADYASYNVTFVSSDDGVPDGPHSTVHFGSDHAALLGLADSVDAYNRDTEQNAIIYVEAFASYETMELTPEQMGIMIANVASHELGHLLGLYHTRNPDDIMDTTGTAWELAQGQDFTRAPLEETVFVIGSEDSPRTLEFAVGLRPDAAKIATPARLRQIPLHDEICRFAAEEAQYTCGTCRNLRLQESSANGLAATAH